ncbi:MAG: hypothetical protein IRZ33_11770, partial [Alicyclobacillaceae bacterium]|nr:hypothetical protein [Alicyclobacillaceae bacterium]
FSARTAVQEYPVLAELFPRIQVIVGDHADVLAAMAADSVDVVVFDPMFRKPPGRPTAMDPVRVFANPSPLSARAWAEAKRVARRCVVLKERPGSGEFERFGLVPDKPRGRFAFGAWCKA